MRKRVNILTMKKNISKHKLKNAKITKITKREKKIQKKFQ